MEFIYSDPDVVTVNGTEVDMNVTIIGLGDGCVGAIQLYVLAASENDQAFWLYTLVCKRNGSTISILSASLGLTNYKSLGAATWDIDVEDGDDGELKLRVRGAAATIVRWTSGAIFSDSLIAS